MVKTYKRICNKCGKEITKEEAIRNNFLCNKDAEWFYSKSFLIRPFIKLPYRKDKTQPMEVRNR